MADNGYEKKNDWLAMRVPGTTTALEYEHYERAAEAHNLYAVGYEIPEIAEHFGISIIDVAADLRHIHKNMSPRQMIAMNNDRQRILLQRENFKKYHRILDESLTMTAKNYIDAGLSPVPAMKEFREAISMTEKPGGLNISFTKNTQNIGVPTGAIHPANFGAHRGGIKSFEDLVRMIIQQDPTCGLQPTVELDAEAQDPTSPNENIDDIASDEVLEDPEEIE